MTITTLSILFLVATLASFIASIVGMAGGAITLSALTFFLDVKTALPIHACVQVVSNFSRVGLSLKKVNWPIFLRYIALVIPGSYLGALMVKEINEDLLEFLIGLFIFISVTVPLPEKIRNFPVNGFYIVGLLASSVGMMVGAVGPLIAPFFMQDFWTKEEVVATKAACQFVLQLMKIPAFLFIAHIDLSAHQDIILYLSIAAIIGTYIGSKFLGKISEARYHQLVKWALIVVSLNMMGQTLARYVHPFG